MGEYFVRSLEPNVSLKKNILWVLSWIFSFEGEVDEGFRFLDNSASEICTPEMRPQTRELGTSGGHQKTVRICQYFGSHNRAPVRDKVEAVRAESRAAPVTALDKYRAWPLNLTHPWPHGAPWSLQWHLSRPLQVPSRAFNGTSRNFTMPR